MEDIIVPNQKRPLQYAIEHVDPISDWLFNKTQPHTCKDHQKPADQGLFNPLYWGNP